MQVGDHRYDSNEICQLYESNGYPPLPPSRQNCPVLFAGAILLPAVSRRRELVLKAHRDLMEHVAGFVAIEPTVIPLIDPVYGD